MSISPGKAAVFGGGLIAGVMVLIFRSTLVSPDVDLSALVATIFSVLAGFLTVALNMIAITRPEAFKSRASQSRYSTEMTRRVRRHNWLFYAYIIILVLVFYAELLMKTLPNIAGIFEALYLGLSAASLIWSLSIPGTIMQLHNESELLRVRIAENEEARRAQP